MGCSTIVRSETPLLPTDFFDTKIGKIEDAGEITQLSENEFQLKQHLGRSSLNNSGEILNFVSFCVAYGLSTRKGYTGWAVTMKPEENNNNARILTIALINNAKELADIPSQTPWSGYVSNEAIWNGGFCKNIVNQKYAKSAK